MLVSKWEECSGKPRGISSYKKTKWLLKTFLGSLEHIFFSGIDFDSDSKEKYTDFAESFLLMQCVCDKAVNVESLKLILTIIYSIWSIQTGW